VSEYYDRSVEDEFLEVQQEYMRELHTGIDVACYAPCNREGIEALRRCIREHKTYPELVGFVYPDGAIW
jgi:hypothetical protein